jgi:L-xylulokinase
MTRGLLLGIDAGQTAGKAALHDAEGREVAVAHAATATSSPFPRWVERDLEEIWLQVSTAVRDVLARAGAAPGDVAAVGIAGHNDGLHLLDAGLAPVRPAILATDTRAHAEAARLASGAIGRRALELTGRVPGPESPAALLTWLRAHEPDAFARVRHVLFCKDWLRYRLVGAIATDPTEASAAFAGVWSQVWSAEALDLYDLGGLAEALPPIVGSAEVAGVVTAAAAAATGLAEGTPVVTGAHDVDANALGIGAHRPGAVSLVLGTYSINQVVTERPVTDPRWQARAFLRPGQWLHMSTSPAGASNLDWAVRRIGPRTASGGSDPAAAVAEAATAVTADDAPVFLPFLHGSPHGAGVAAAWVGLRDRHTRADLLRAVLEGVVLNHRTHVSALREAFAVEPPVRVCGGGARSPEWTALLAGALDLPVEVTDADEAGARGAALLAGVGTGVYADLDDAVARTVRVTRRQEPDRDLVAALDRRYARYRRVVEALSGLDP